MKKIYTFITAMFFASAMFAQNFTYTPSKDIVATVVNTTSETYNIDIRMVTPKAITYEWELVSNTFPLGWDYSLCDYGNCYVALPFNVTKSMTPITLNQAQSVPDTVGFFKLSVITGTTYGSGKLEIYVYDSTDPTGGDTVSWELSLPVGIEDVNNSKVFSFYPNPAKNDVVLSNPTNNTLDISIYNLLGENVANKSLAPSSSKMFDTSKLNNGVYFVSYIDPKGIRKTERLILSE
jgi:hypothetical protein